MGEPTRPSEDAVLSKASLHCGQECYNRYIAGGDDNINPTLPAILLPQNSFQPCVGEDSHTTRLFVVFLELRTSYCFAASPVTCGCVLTSYGLPLLTTIFYIEYYHSCDLLYSQLLSVALFLFPATPLPRVLDHQVWLTTSSSSSS